jgi:hypothetical protein
VCLIDDTKPFVKKSSTKPRGHKIDDTESCPKKKIDSTELLNRTEIQIHIFLANKGKPSNWTASHFVS